MSRQIEYQHSNPKIGTLNFQTHPPTIDSQDQIDPYFVALSIGLPTSGSISLILESPHLPITNSSSSLYQTESASPLNLFLKRWIF